MRQFSLMRHNWLSTIVGLFLMGVLSSCIHVDCKGECCGTVVGGGDRNCPLTTTGVDEPDSGAKCRFPGHQGIDCDDDNPDHVCTTTSVPNGEGGQHFVCKCCPEAGCS